MKLPEVNLIYTVVGYMECPDGSFKSKGLNTIITNWDVVHYLCYGQR